MTIPYSAGALYSTVEDLYLWDQALYTEKLLSKKSLDTMFTPVKNNYGYGWGIDTRQGITAIAHGGGIDGFVTFIARYPDAKAVIIVLCNNMRANPGAVVRDLAKMTLADKMTPAAGEKANSAKQ
jgi:CubicO group peptidase (beta-lactamase class C family)